jgi:lysophospholipase L1-like esterase
MSAAGGTPRFSLGRSLLHSTLLVVAFFGAVEGILRLVGAASPVERPRILLREMDSDIVLPFVRPDREVFWSPRPGFRGVFRGSPVSINSLGLRGAELARPKPAGRRRIACFGDSITFGFGVGDDETYSHLLGRLLAPRDVEVVNAGVTGFTSHQVLGWLRRLLPQTEPDVVTILVGWNDQNGRPLTDRDYEARLRAARAVEGPLDRLRLYAAMKTLYSRLGKGREPVAGSVERVPPDHFRENLHAIVSQCRSRGIRPVFVALPHRKSAGELPVRTPYESLLAQVARENGVPLLDVGELGLATPVEDNAEDFLDALHLSARGNALMARRLAEQLAALGILPAEDEGQRATAPS